MTDRACEHAIAEAPIGFPEGHSRQMTSLVAFASGIRAAIVTPVNVEVGAKRGDGLDFGDKSIKNQFPTVKKAALAEVDLLDGRKTHARKASFGDAGQDAGIRGRIPLGRQAEPEGRVAE